MKKRLLSALLALALVFVLLPTTALAEVVRDYFDCDISILGNYWKFEKDSNNEYLPVYYRSEASSFEDSTIAPENNYLEIRKTGEKEITITVHGDVNITATGISIDTIAASKSVIINGNGHLTVKYTWIESGQNYSAIDVSTLTVEGVALSAEASMGPALSATYGIHIKDGAMVEAKAGYYEAVCEGTGGITIDNATLVATATGGGNQSAIKTYGDIAITNAKVTATNKSSENAAIQAKTYKGTLNHLYVSGTSTITATNQSTSTDTMARAIGATIKNNNTSEKIEVGSSKVDAGKTWYTNAKQVTITSPALETTSYVYIAGGPAVVGQWTTITANSCSGSYYYDAAKKELTLKDVNITRNNNNNIHHAIQFTKNGDYTINLEGTNNISSVTNGICALNKAFYDDPANISVTITGTGSLNVTANTYAIDMQVGNLIFNSTGNITLTTNCNFVDPRNALHVAGKITIDNTKYDIVGKRQDAAETTETISDSSEFDPAYLNGYTVGGETTLFKTITITPAAPKKSTISYGGTTLTQGEIIKGENGGTATVDSKNNTITLNNFKGTKALSFEATLADSTLVLEGTNTLSSIVTTQKGLTISGSGSGSLTVGSIRVTNNDNISADLIITGGAQVTVNRPSGGDEPAVEVSGNLTVTGDGTQLSAECTAATNPAIEVGGNVTISGNPGTDAYTVKAYNKYDTPRDRVEGLSPSQMPSAIEISGDSLSISNSARVMAKTKSDGAAVWMPALKVISVADASLIAQNSSHNFSTISFGDESNMGNIYAKGQVNIVAENMLGSNSRLAHKAIKAYIYNHYSTGDSNPYYIKVVSEGVQSGGNVNVIPGHHTSTGDYKVTITRGDAYTTPQVAANYTIAGQTMYVGKYYKTAANGNITDGTAQDYNIYCDSENDFTLNNATISSTGKGGSTGVIMTDPNASSNEIHIKLIGTNSINNAGHHAILGKGSDSTIIIENAENASNASLTISGNFLPVYSFGNVTINAEVVIINTNGNLISTNKGGHANGAFDLGSGYKCYASTDVSGSPLEAYDAAKGSTYKYLRVTTQTLETGGGSTHQHTSETGWETDGTNHWKTCSTCSQRYNEGACTISGYNNDNGASGYHKVLCSVGHVMKTESHDYEYKITQDGTMHYKECKTCHYTTPPVSHNFGSSGTESCECGAIPSHTHNLSGQKGNDETNHWDICSECSQHINEAPHTYGAWITDTPATDTTDGSKHRTCSVCQYQENATIPKTGTGEIVPPTPDNPGTIVIIRPAEEEKPAQQPNPSTGANDLVGLAVAAAVAAALGSAALLRKHD